MIRTVYAIEFQKRLQKGSKWPILCTCQEGNKSIDVIAKFSGKLLRDRFSLVIEYIASVLAHDLGIESSTIVAVKTPESFVQSVLEAGDKPCADLIQRSLDLNVGSIFLGPGFNVVKPSEKMLARQRSYFADIVAFDFLIQNLDRQPDNPNVLRKGEKFVLIDHEQAFGHLDEHHQQEFHTDKLRIAGFFNHIFSSSIDFTTDFRPFFERLQCLPDTCFDGYFKALPQDWGTTEQRCWQNIYAGHVNMQLKSVGT